MAQRPARRKPKERWLSFERRILGMAMMAGLPGSLVALILLWAGSFTPRTQWTLTSFILALWWGFAFALRRRVVTPLQTLANLLGALREEDYSVRARFPRTDDALTEVMREANALSEMLRDQRMGALEATTLLRKVMAEIDVAIFAFDADERLRLINRAGEQLLRQPSERLMGLSASELGLAGSLEGEGQAGDQTMQMTFPGGTGKWGVRRSAFRERGLPMQLLVLSDLSRPLRQEERQAWQRLIRVLGHELNNSLAPIKSMAGSLETLLLREPRPSDWLEDTRRGLAVIAARADALSRFMASYARWAKLPQPTFRPVNVNTWVRRVVSLETRLKVTLDPGPDFVIQADGDQLEQVLINLVQNAVDASLETGGAVKVGWKKNATHLDLFVQDEGPGLSNTANLFVPFFTTKPGGSGIGLVLSREIAEAHRGTLTLANRRPGPGCEARLRLPL